jgi:hypothetical protein
VTTEDCWDFYGDVWGAIMVSGYLGCIEIRLGEARSHLRAQHAIVPTINSSGLNHALIKLLSNTLRVFCWLEGERKTAMKNVELQSSSLL